ncbi:PAS domain-containing protein [Halorhabdus rudnickae]|uniref:PAS domain-containing protein n=1 Tax=Halorhabdus rudnickae TaxID=1775544 RepID=UPI001082CB41|nr:PAS domain-containing protein [Halorhabdus rudnickae]
MAHVEKDSGAKRVLYVNDDEAFADLVGTKLPRIDPTIEITTVRDAEAAIEAVSTTAIDCVVTSYALPEGTGIDLLEAIQARHADVPTILFTGRGSEEIASRAIQANVSDYIPIRSNAESFELLARRIDTLVGAKRERAMAERVTDRFERTLERATDAIYAVDTEWRIEYMNEKMAARIDRDREAVIGENLWEAFPSIVGTELEAKYRTAMETGQQVSFEQYVSSPFEYWVEVRAFPDEDGLTIFSQEITEQRERQQELQRNETILRNVQDSVIVLDADRTVAFANAAATASMSASVGRPLEGGSLDVLVEELLPEPDAERFSRTVEDAFRAIEDSNGDVEGDDVELQIELEAASGTGTFDVRLTPFRSGEDSQVLVVARDITDRTDRQRERQRLAEEYDALLSNSGDAIFLIDVDTADSDEFRFSRLSPGYETQTGLTTAEVQGKTPQAIFGEERGAELDANYRRCLEAGEPISYREELSVAEDARFWQTSLAPIVVDGEVIRILGIARNITEQVVRERELEETRQRLESLIDAAPLTIMEVDPDGNVRRWNQGAEEMFGWSREEVLGEFNPMVPADKREEFADLRQRVLAGEQIRGREIRRETKCGDRLDLLLSVTSIVDSDGEPTSILAVLEDISQQKQLERRLRALQETAQQLSGAQSVEEIGDLAVEAAVDVLDLEITGVWEYNERTNTLDPIVQTDGADEIFGAQPQFEAGEGLAWDAFESGELRWYDDIQSTDEVYNPDTDIRSEILIPLGEYGLISTGSTSPHVFSDADVDLFRILGATVEAALARASREAELTRQNERLDQFASVVAHDLRNPLTVAMGFLEVAAESGDPAHFEKVESAHDRIERLIDDLLTLARGESTIEDAEQIDLEPLSTEAWGYVDTDAATLRVAEDVPTVAGDAGRLTQLFENLFRNAVEHGSTTPRSSSTRDDAVEHGGTDVQIAVGSLPDRAGFYVEDDGEGIPPERRETVFDHGVTTNEGGTGFGLSIVEDIALAHGWTVSVTEGTEGGARFEFETEP